MQDAIFQGLVNRFKEFRRDKTRPKTKSAETTIPPAKGKSPGITKPVVIPAVQVHVYAHSPSTGLITPPLHNLAYIYALCPWALLVCAFVCRAYIYAKSLNRVL